MGAPFPVGEPCCAGQQDAHTAKRENCEPTLRVHACGRGHGRWRVQPRMQRGYVRECRGDRRGRRTHRLVLLARHRRDEAVSPFRDCLDKAWTFRRVPERIPQTLYGRIDAVIEFDSRIVGPQPLPDLFSRHQLARAFQKFEKDKKGLLLQADSLSAPSQLRGSEVELKLAKANNRGRH